MEIDYEKIFFAVVSTRSGFDVICSRKKNRKHEKKKQKKMIFNVFGLILQVSAGISMWKRLVEVFSC